MKLVLFSKIHQPESDDTPKNTSETLGVDKTDDGMKFIVAKDQPQSEEPREGIRIRPLL
jgi:hypothetical protein